MTDCPRELLLPSSADRPDTLADFLKGASGTDVTIRIEPERPLSALEAQLILAAVADPAGPASLRLAPGSTRLRSGLRLLGIEDRIEIAG